MLRSFLVKRNVLFILPLLSGLNLVGCSVNTKIPYQVAIASAHPLATKAGFDILHQGGNVFDAAVAVSAALAVVEPSGSGLGGGGFWLLHDEKKAIDVMLDGREKAPLAASKTMYQNSSGTVIDELSLNGALAAGIPGLPAGLVALSKAYGRLPLAQSLQPAIKYAEQGFAIGQRHRKLLAFRRAVLNKSPETAAIFLDKADVPALGAILRQEELANTLKYIADKGHAGFYRGVLAEKLVQSVQQMGGIWSLEDLARYQVIRREPIRGQYKHLKISSAALPSSGGLVLIESLNILEAFSLPHIDALSRTHLIVEAMRRAYHDRALYLGDMDFVKVPMKRLLSKEYARGLASTIRSDKALPSHFLTAVQAEKPKGRNTTHFSIIDSEGNRVAATLSINYPFGAGVVAAGTGVLLNNEMDDFVSAAAVKNGYGLVGGDANSIAPEKRMLSSMTPTFLETKERVGVLGTPGGSRIISMVLLAALDFAQGHGPDSWVRVKRFHHQYLPDQILYERGGLTAQEQAGLKALGHDIKAYYNYGNMQAVAWNKVTGQLSAASDPRGEGAAEVQTIAR